MNAAKVLDPANPLIHAALSGHLVIIKNFDGAISEVEDTLSLTDADKAANERLRDIANHNLNFAYRAKGNTVKAADYKETTRSDVHHTSVTV